MGKRRVAAGYDRSPWLGVRGVVALCRLLMLGVPFYFLHATVGAAQQNAKSVLVVFSGVSPDHRPLDLMESAVRARIAGPVNFSVAYVDYQRVEQKSYRETLAETFRRGYGDPKPDVLIVGGIQALQFVMEYRDRMFPGVPVVFHGVSTGELEGKKILPGVTGITSSPGLRATIDLALRLDPDTTAFAVITDTPGDAEKFWLQVANTEVLRHQDRVKVIDVVGPPSRQMLERISSLPPHTVALFQLAPQSSAEPAIGAFDVLVATAQHMPTYSAWNTLCLNHGCIGGAYNDWEREDLLSGEIAARLLSGERPENIPVVDASAYQVTVDWRALQRWHIPESALPSGSVILYRQPSIWEQYRKYILAAVVLIVVQALFILGLLWQRARKRKAEAALQESEKRFRMMADNTPSLIWVCDQDGMVTYLNNTRLEFTGGDAADGHGDTWTRYVHPEDLDSVLEAVSLALKTRRPFSKQYRLRRFDGVYRWIFDFGSPRVNEDGSFAGFIGSAVDITDQKLAQEALEQVGGRLIEAQEQERTRIARELHDDICQRLAVLSFELERASQNGSPPETKEQLDEIRGFCSDIGRDVQSLSHKLHSSKLDYLGVTAALRGFCDEFSRQHQVSIDFKEANMPAHVPKDVSLCLFRVAQEALHNAAKYSGASQFRVELSATGNELRLMIRDGGAGFDIEEVRKGSGLGLVSMQERVHLVHGRLCVESRPGYGTTVVAVVPATLTATEPSLNRQTASHM